MLGVSLALHSTWRTLPTPAGHTLRPQATSQPLRRSRKRRGCANRSTFESLVCRAGRAPTVEVRTPRVTIIARRLFARSSTHTSLPRAASTPAAGTTRRPAVRFASRRAPRRARRTLCEGGPNERRRCTLRAHLCAFIDGLAPTDGTVRVSQHGAVVHLPGRGAQRVWNRTHVDHYLALVPPRTWIGRRGGERPSRREMMGANP